MPQEPSPTIENHFIAGLKTEFTGLNFPENAATDTQNCVYSLIGDVTRRGGINFEANNGYKISDVNNAAKSSFKWTNAGGDGQSEILVIQTGGVLNFYLVSAATIQGTNPTGMSRTWLGTPIFLSNFLPTNSRNDPTQIECQYSAGNGYLFVYHPYLDPFYCIFQPGVGAVTANVITLNIRDLTGILEPGVPDNYRPPNLTAEHNYNLLNQGWTQGAGWSGTAISLNTGGAIPQPGTSCTLTISQQTNTNVVIAGDEVSVTILQAAGAGGNPHTNGTVTLTGTVTSYVTPFTSMTITVTSNSNPALNVQGEWSGGNFTVLPNQAMSMILVNEGFIQTWFAALNSYPSNSDVWWLYKAGVSTTSGSTTIGVDQFAPTATIPYVQQSVTPAPKGSFLMNAFIQNRTQVSGIAGLTTVQTNNRPSTGAFYAGRVFYAGVNASQVAQGDQQFYTWTENIYFSQIVETASDFGQCYQTNDPTSQNLFAILPSDGGVISIPGCGAIYKLFALRFGLLVFAANGIWFISGSTGVGFTATDYTVTKISSIVAIGGASFIDVQGLPMFWNQEGIYLVEPSSQPGSAHSPDIQLSVNNLTLGTILGYYNNIPTTSKGFARGDYNYIDYIVQWVFRSTQESGIGNRYQYDTILSYNTVTKAFYPYTIPASTSPYIFDIKYIVVPGSITSPPPVFKYLTSVFGSVTFSEENDFTNFVDFFGQFSFPYTSYFVTGYNLPGQSLRKAQIPYVYMFSRNPGTNGYSIRAIWDYAGSQSLGQVDALSGKWSTKQVITNNQTDFSMIYRKIRLRGRGLAVQIRVESQPGLPFDLMGWSVWNEVNQGI